MRTLVSASTIDFYYIYIYFGTNLLRFIPDELYEDQDPKIRQAGQSPKRMILV